MDLGSMCRAVRGIDAAFWNATNPQCTPKSVYAYLGGIMIARVNLREDSLKTVFAIVRATSEENSENWQE
jgi:hypothetical protein